jgi:hypothetical protein
MTLNGPAPVPASGPASRTCRAVLSRHSFQATAEALAKADRVSRFIFECQRTLPRTPLLAKAFGVSGLTTNHNQPRHIDARQSKKFRKKRSNFDRARHFRLRGATARQAVRGAFPRCTGSKAHNVKVWWSVSAAPGQPAQTNFGAPAGRKRVARGKRSEASAAPGSGPKNITPLPTRSARAMARASRAGGEPRLQLLGLRALMPSKLWNRNKLSWNAFGTYSVVSFLYLA